MRSLVRLVRTALVARSGELDVDDAVVELEREDVSVVESSSSLEPRVVAVVPDVELHREDGR